MVPIWFGVTSHVVDAAPFMTLLPHSRRGKRLLKKITRLPPGHPSISEFQTFQRYPGIRLIGETSEPFVGRACNWFAAFGFPISDHRGVHGGWRARYIFVGSLLFFFRMIPLLLAC